jgi:hypothetical protein
MHGMQHTMPSGVHHFDNALLTTSVADMKQQLQRQPLQ